MAKGFNITNQKVSLNLNLNGTLSVSQPPISRLSSESSWPGRVEPELTFPIVSSILYLQGYTEITVVPTTELLATVWLHARQLTVHRVSYRSEQGDVRLSFSHQPPATPVLTEPDNAHTYPELKRAIWKATNEGEEGELGISIPSSCLSRVPSQEGATPAAGRDNNKEDEFRPFNIVVEYSVDKPGDGLVAVGPDEANPSVSGGARVLRKAGKLPGA